MASDLERELDLTILRYSRVDEDHRVLSKALKIVPDHDVVLSITSAGDNVLNLLLERPKKIVSIDVSVAQNSLLELKITAINYLNYHDYLLLIGETPGSASERKKLYEEIKDHMPKYAIEYFDSHINLVMDGLSSCGRLQKYFLEQFSLRLSQCVDSTMLDKFLESKNIDDQRKCFLQLPLDKLKGVLHDLVLNQISGRSAAQLKNVSLSYTEMSELIWKRFYSTSMNVPVKDNFYLSIFLKGERSKCLPPPDYLLPPYLTINGFSSLKNLVSRLEIYTGSIEQYLLTTSLKFHKMNLSDVFEYMTSEKSDDVFSKLSLRCFDGGYLAYWNLFNSRYPQENCKWVYKKSISEQLCEIDRVFFFEFCLLQMYQ